jgi:hypothetical protein
MSEHGGLLDGYLEEHEFAKQRGVSVQTQRRDRKLGKSPPYVRVGKRFYYPSALAKEHLAAQVVYPPRSPLAPPSPAHPKIRHRPEAQRPPPVRARRSQRSASA